MNVAAYLNDIGLEANLSKYNEDVTADLTVNLKETQATMDDIRANLNNLKLVLNNVSTTLGSEGLGDLMAAFRITASNLSYSSEGMMTQTGNIIMKADKALLAGDSANVSGFTFDSRDISLQLEDSVGTITKASIAKVLLGLEGALKLDLSDVATGLTIDVNGTEYNQGGDDPINVITDELSLKADATIKGDNIALLTEFNTPSIRIEMDSDLYVPGWSFGFTLPIETNRDITRFNVKEGSNIRIDGQQITVLFRFYNSFTGSFRKKLGILYITDIPALCRDKCKKRAVCPAVIKNLLKRIHCFLKALRLLTPEKHQTGDSQACTL
jgi:hypothetical protein